MRAAAAAGVAAALAGTTVAADAKPTKAKGLIPVQLLAFNDFHGQLETNDRNTVEGQPAGGSEYLVGGGEDLDALIGYLGEEGPIAPPGTDRVTEIR